MEATPVYASDLNDMIPADDKWYSVYVYRWHSVVDADGKLIPLFWLARVAGPYPSEAVARNARDREDLVAHLDDYTVRVDRGEHYGHIPCRGKE